MTVAYRDRWILRLLLSNSGESRLRDWTRRKDIASADGDGGVADRVLRGSSAHYRTRTCQCIVTSNVNEIKLCSHTICTQTLSHQSQYPYACDMHWPPRPSARNCAAVRTVLFGWWRPTYQAHALTSVACGGRSLLRSFPRIKGNESSSRPPPPGGWVHDPSQSSPPTSLGGNRRPDPPRLACIPRGSLHPLNIVHQSR